MKKHFIVIAWMLVLGILLTACGESGTASAAASSTASEVTEATTVDVDSAGSETASAVEEDSASYADTLFDRTMVHEINVEISEADWADLLANPMDKTKYQVNVTIDGETVESVSFATKGNTSLSSVATSDSDRYSFKLNFGKYVDGQTYRGLNKLNLNNLYADATYMKDYLSYRIFEEAGLDAPLTSYVFLTINGENAGLYLAIEEVGESYLSRTGRDGQLYKPETEILGNMGQMGDAPEGMEPPDGMELPEGMEMPNMEMPNMDFPGDMELPEGMELPGGMFFAGFGGSSSGASLKYSDDERSSYADIFDNAETDATEEDEQRVVEALKALSQGNVTDAVDVEQVITYFAAHNFVMNYDSYTGTMLHNYYLYESDGKLSMLPWDYNLAFGAFSGAAVGAGATGLVNCGIDSPLSGASEEDRPMWQWIAESPEYLEQYHAVLDRLMTNYLESGDCAAEIAAVWEMILPYVQEDATAFYTADEFTAAVETLTAFCQKRAESIRLQLDGTLAAVTEEQDSALQVDASDIDISTMGSQGGGNEMPQNFGPMGGNPQ